MYRLARCVLTCNGLESKLFVNNISICAQSTRSILNSHDTENDNISKVQSVKDFYAGKKIFITGCTGFLGKVLIERLLSNTDIDSIYVLIREKKGHSISSRLKQLLDVPIFDKLKQMKPHCLNRLIPIEGDIAIENIGLRPEDEEKLIDNVSLVIHSAATVKFIDTFRTIMTVNYEGTKKVMELSKKMKNLETFAYISTAYSNGNRKVIDEVVYSPAKQPDEVYRFIERHGDNEQEIQKFLDGFPNTYTLSKNLCETFVSLEHGSVRSIIVRPSIVSPALSTSVPGWCDSWVAATALFSDVARGLTKVAYGHQAVVCDLIPVDYVCNLALVAAARGNKSNEVLVYNSCSSSTNPITWREASDLYLEESLRQRRGSGSLKPRKVTLSTSPLMVSLLTFTGQTVPAYLADLWLQCKGEKPRHMSMQPRAVLLRDVVRGFTSTSFLMVSRRAQRLIDSMNEEDKVLFPCDPNTINWKDYMKTFYYGVNRFLLKNGK